MKTLKKLLFAIFILLILPKNVIHASNKLTIDSKNYNANTSVFTVSGTSNYSEVMVSLFDGNKLLTFKTVTASDNHYSASFNISFDEDKTVTIKVGDINSTDYEMSTINVKKSLIPVKSNKITDDDDNSLTILNSLKKFELDDELDIEFIFIDDDLDDDDMATLEAIQTILGQRRQVIGAIKISVTNHGEPVELDEINQGYELFLNLNEDDLSSFTKPYATRVLDFDDLEFEKGQQMKCSDEENGCILKLNNVGLYILYDDISIEYDFLDKTANQTYYLLKRGTLKLRIDADYEKFEDIYIDDKLVDPKNYTSKSGSTIIEFKEAYMQSLKEGTHTIVVNFRDGEARTELTIKSSATNPKTGDSMIYYAIGLLIAIGGIITTLICIKREKRN